jgi:hypothetical protein
MDKENFNTWLENQVTRKFFEFIEDEEQRLIDELLNGAPSFINKNSTDYLIGLGKCLGYINAFRDLRQLDYKDLVEIEKI